MHSDKNILRTEDEITRDFSRFKDWDEKYTYLIMLGKELPQLAEKHKSAKNLIRGCQSDAWLVADFSDGLVYFKADSDALIVRGLMSLLIRVLSGQSPQAILAAKLDFIDQIGMRQHLTPMRSNGLRSVITKMRSYAMHFRPEAARENLYKQSGKSSF